MSTLQGVRIHLKKSATANTSEGARANPRAPHNQSFINPKPEQKKKGKKYPKSNVVKLK